MRKTLLLTLTLILGLFIFSGCEMANNPMEVESTYSGSTELTKSSEVDTITYKIINSISNGNYVLFLFHEGHTVEVESILVNGIEAEIIAQINNTIKGITKIVFSFDVSDTSELNFVLNLNIDGVFYPTKAKFGDGEYWISNYIIISNR